MAFPSPIVLSIVTVTFLISYRVLSNLYFHPLSRFRGPWYCAASSFPLAIISLRRREPQWLLNLTKQYSHNSDEPIRIAPILLFFPKPASIKDIYTDPRNNTKANLYGAGLLGPPHLFSTLKGPDHKALRKALGGPQWSFGALKTVWEARIDEHINLFTSKLLTASRQDDQPLVLSDRISYFTADIMTLLSFGSPWGYVANSRDEHSILKSLRDVLDFLGFAMRFRFIRDTVLESPLAGYLLPSETDPTGYGFLLGQANKLVTEREAQMSQAFAPERKDYLHHALSAKINGNPLTPAQKRAHVTLLFQAGTDTVGTAIGCMLRFLLKDPTYLAKAVSEIDAARKAGYLSSPVQYEETRAHLPFVVTCIKEGIRLHPPATNLFARVSRDGATRVGSTVMPEGAEMTTYAYVVQRDPEVFAPDPEAFRPERWLESEERCAKMDAASFAWGAGARVCLGKDVAMFEMYKLLPEILRRFEMELVDEGEYIVAGGVAYNRNLVVKVRERK
ncbi:Pisatin demethylase [Podospora aff. communis PSN243]|uniref:Pisatin demethylase n=1 Tax=Podospora aff. communis PSN243 TaxID=3040156 RepID=A0AAV9G7G1_9PEZI|nr:Pisatin demethylase [Podospora aff. communis PSN243]